MGASSTASPAFFQDLVREVQSRATSPCLESVVLSGVQRLCLCSTCTVFWLSCLEVVAGMVLHHQHPIQNPPTAASTCISTAERASLPTQHGTVQAVPSTHSQSTATPACLSWAGSVAFSILRGLTWYLQSLPQAQSLTPRLFKV